MSLASDYQIFDFVDGKIANVRGRMADKLAWMPAIAKGARALDVGCDFGFWCWWAREQGASSVLGIDRGRDVKGQGFVDTAAVNTAFASRHGLDDVCRFERLELGRQWPALGTFDFAFMMSVYHHIYEACGDHNAIWSWLRTQCADDATVIWEGPVDTSDPVVMANVSPENQHGYTLDAIRGAAQRYFDMELIGPAVHEATRWAYVMRPRPRRLEIIPAEARDGAGGALKAFRHANGRRAKEIEHILGIDPYPGTLNLRLSRPFDFDRGYVRARIMDAVDRSQGFDGQWAPRWCRFYPVQYDGHEAWAMRFEGERYAENFVEILTDFRLRSDCRPKAMLTRVD